MRTTLTLDDDLAGLLRRQARNTERPFKEVLNQALRRGLTGTQPAAGRKIRVRPHDFGANPGLDFDRMNQMTDALEAQAWAQQQRRHGRR
jgi:hypothetical protein